LHVLNLISNLAFLISIISLGNIKLKYYVRREKQLAMR